MISSDLSHPRLESLIFKTASVQRDFANTFEATDIRGERRRSGPNQATLDLEINIAPMADVRGSSEGRLKEGLVETTKAVDCPPRSGSQL